MSPSTIAHARCMRCKLRVWWYTNAEGRRLGRAYCPRCARKLRRVEEVNLSLERAADPIFASSAQAARDELARRVLR